MEIKPCIKVAVLGAESTGKTQLCQALATEFNTVWVPEYAREYFNHSDIYNYTLADLVTIAKKQMEDEQKLAQQAKRFLFCDTALITLKIWADLEFQSCPPFILLSMAINEYDYYLITNNEPAWEKDEQRLNKFSRDLIFELNKSEVKALHKPYFVVEGLNENRSKNAINFIKGLKV